MSSQTEEVKSPAVYSRALALPEPNMTLLKAKLNFICKSKKYRDTIYFSGSLRAEV